MKEGPVFETPVLYDMESLRDWRREHDYPLHTYVAMRVKDEMGRQKNLHKTMEDLFTEVHRLLGAGEFEACNQILAKIDPEKEHPVMVSGLLRACLPARSKISEWGPLLSRTRRVLEEGDRILRGLVGILS